MDEESAANTGRRPALPECARGEEREGLRKEQQILVGGVNREQLYQGVQGMGREQQILV